MFYLGIIYDKHTRVWEGIWENDWSMAWVFCLNSYLDHSRKTSTSCLHNHASCLMYKINWLEGLFIINRSILLWYDQNKTSYYLKVPIQIMISEGIETKTHSNQSLDCTYLLSCLEIVSSSYCNQLKLFYKIPIKWMSLVFGWFIIKIVLCQTQHLDPLWSGPALVSSCQLLKIFIVNCDVTLEYSTQPGKFQK